MTNDQVPMTNNPILEEIYIAREKLLESVGGDVHKYLEGVRARELASGRLLPPTPQQMVRPIEPLESVVERQLMTND